MHCEGSVTLFLGDDNSWPYARQNDLCVIDAIDAIDALSLWLRTSSTRPSLAFPNEAWSSPSLSAQCFPRGEWRTSLQDPTRSYKMTGQDGQDPMLFGLEATSNLFLHVFHVKWLKYSKVGKMTKDMVAPGLIPALLPGHPSRTDIERKLSSRASELRNSQEHRPGEIRCSCEALRNEYIYIIYIYYI